MRTPKSVFTALSASAALLAARWALAADAPAASPAEPPVNWHAVVMFIIFVSITLMITYWAAKRTKTATDFYAAGRGITGFQNGMAIAGDYMSAASFLGIAALVYFNGFYGLIFSVGWLVGWPIILFLIAERLRNLGKFTYADVASFRLQQGPVRTMAAIGSLIVVIWYLIGQAVGAGQLLHTLVPQISYRVSIVIIGALIIIYVTFGGMKATTWVQIIKAGLLLGGATLMALGVMAHEGWSFNNLFSNAVKSHPKGLEIMKSVVPIGAKSNPIESISLGLTLMFGTAGLPHILMRFFTVGDAKAARKSVLYGTIFIGYFYILTFIIGFGAIVLVANNPEYVVDVTKNVLNLKGGSSMPAVYLSHAHRRRFLPRLHRRGGICHDSGGGLRPDARRRIGAVTRHLCQRDHEGQSHRGAGSVGVEDLRDRPWHPRRDPGHRLREAERRLYRGVDVLDRRLRQLPDSGAGRVLARDSPRAGRCSVAIRGSSGRSVC